MRVRIAKVLLVLLSVLPTAAAQPRAGGRFDSVAEREMVGLLNNARTQAGLPPLEIDDRLTQAAREHSLLMAQKGTLSHQFAGEPKVAERLAATGIRFNNDGENVAFDSGSPADAHRGLMDSPHHRANILSQAYNAVGVGVVRKGDLIYVTEDFARRLQEYSVPQAENVAAQTFATVRQKAGAPPATRLNVPVLRTQACSMARDGQLNTRAALADRRAHYAVAYTQGEPGRLPSSAVELASDRRIKTYAVGACYATSNKYPSGTWWIVMVFY